jgi:Flp pilus assembly protein TadG
MATNYPLKMPRISTNQDRATAEQSGAAMVEAAVVLPIFLAVLFISINALVFCFHLLRFQYELSDLTRQTFVLSQSERGSLVGTGANASWQSFLETMINNRAMKIGLTTNSPASYASVQFISKSIGTCSGWNCTTSANAGDLFTISVRLEEPIFGASLAGISWTNISIDVKALAFIQTEQSI